MSKQIITVSDNAAQKIKEILLNAEKDAVGVRVDEIPITPDKIFKEEI